MNGDYMYQLMQQVLAFHNRMGQPIGDPRKPDISIEQDFRLALITEEFRELQVALAGFKKDAEGSLIPFVCSEDQIAAVADGLGDLCYVIAGSAVAWGLDMGPVLDAIHESNMSKTPNPNGKAIKGPDFKPVNLQAVIAQSARDFQEEQDLIGPEDYAYWPEPRRERVGCMSTELAQVKQETLPGIS